MNPADQHIAKLIESLCETASSWTASDEDKQRAIDQIAKLRQSMEPKQIIKQEK